MVPRDLSSAEAEPLSDAGDRLRRALSPRYVVERELARGAMGVVFLARDTRHDRPVAIKLLDPERAATIGRERFSREIHAAAQLVHPNILPVFESGEADGLVYYVMPYVEGDSLRDLLSRDGPLPVEDAVALAADLAEALDCAHGHGVIHRDVKPENVLLPVPHHACLSDFGVAHSPAQPGDPRLTSAGRLLGSPLYMSPEQAAGYEVDGRADIYGLGCVLFEMLTGRPPFTGDRVEGVLIGHLSEAPPLLRSLRPDAPAWLEAVIARALAKVPEERFTNAGELAATLRAGWHTLPGDMAAATATPVGATVVATRGARRAIVWLAGGLLAAGVGAAVWRWHGNEKAPPVPAAATAGPERIAILYFDDLSPKQDLGYLTAGLTQSLIDRFTQAALHVVSINGVKPFRNRPIPPDSIARALNVGTIVAGSAQRSGDRLRVSIQLVDAVSGSPLNATTVERKFTELFALEDSVGDEVERFLRERLGQHMRVRRLQAETRSVAAWQYFHEAEEARGGLRDLQPFADSASLAAALSLLHRADSLFARAEAADRRWIAPTVERGWLAIQQRDLHPLDRASAAAWLAIARRHAASASRRNAGDPRVLELEGRLAYRLAWIARDRREADSLFALSERNLRAATQADPTRASAWGALSVLMQLRGRFGEAIVAGQRALKEDAYLAEGRDVVYGLFNSAFQSGDLTTANEWCARGERQFPADPRFPQCRLQLMATPGSGMPDAARAWQALAEIDRRVAHGHGDEALPQLWVFRRMMVAAVLARAGLGDSAAAVLRRTQDGIRSDRALLRGSFAFYAAQVELLRGDRARALDWLGVYVAEDPTRRKLVATFFIFRELHSDPRFRALVGGE